MSRLVVRGAVIVMLSSTVIWQVSVFGSVQPSMAYSSLGP
jgi:hypothetical protein